jgi:uncharacterized protein (DUF697 family)
MGLVGGALGFIQVVRELDLGEIEQQLTAPLRILVTGSDLAQAGRLAEALFGPSGVPSWAVAVASLCEGELGDDQADLVLLAVQPTEDPLALLERYRRRPRRASAPVLAVLRGSSPTAGAAEDEDAPCFRVVAIPDDDAAALTRHVPPAALDLAPEHALALGRRFPAFRPVVAERLIRETSRVNAQFAFLSNLPANLPLVGGLAGDVADLAVLTKNQALLVFKLAGVHGRDMQDRVSLAMEIAPVIGGAFVWRTLARSLLGLLPTAIGGLPKAVVAYGGTYAVGEMARYYYSTGRRPPPELVARFQAEGARLANEAANLLRGWRESRPNR